MSLSIALNLGRISNLPTVWSNVLAGMVMAGGALDHRFIPAGLSLSLFYVGGMYLNDAFDRGIDAIERPERPIPAHARSSRHHLTPKLKGGAHQDTVRLHQICHSAIHARYNEAEIARRLSGVESLRADPELARFCAWVRTKPDDFHAPTRRSRAHRRRR